MLSPVFRWLGSPAGAQSIINIARETEPTLADALAIKAPWQQMTNWRFRYKAARWLEWP